MSLPFRLTDELIREALTPAGGTSAEVASELGAEIRATVRVTRQARPWWWPLRSVLGPFGPSREVRLVLALAALVALALLAIAVASRRSTPLGDQTMFHGGPARTGEVVGIGPAGQPAMLHSANLAGPLANAMPALADNRLFVADGRGNVAVFDSATLAQGWTRQLAKPATSPAIANGVLVLGAGDGVYGLDAALGTVRWKLPTSAPVLSAPAILAATAYVGLPDGSIAALDVQSGVPRWRSDAFAIGGAIDRAPAVADGMVFAGGDGGTFTALDAVTGTPLWSRSLGPGQVSTPAVRDGVVYAAAGLDHPEDPHRMYALDERTGTVQWTFEVAGGEAIYVGAIGPNAAYAVSLDGSVYAVRAGRELWHVGAGAPIGSVATLGGNVLYVSASDGSILAIDAASGATRWVIHVDGDPGPVIVAGGRLWVGTDLGILYEFGAAPPDA
jgi:outer membrane protein assembly factor BamB